MAMTIRDEESCIDRSIYLRVKCQVENNTKDCWYVIEQKPECQSESSLSGGLSSSSSRTSSSSSFSSSDQDECESESSGNIDLDCKSVYDTIKRLSVPHQQSLPHNSLAVLNSHIYLIGGDDGTALKNTDDGKIGYRHLPLGKSSRWLLDGGYLNHDQFEAAAVSHDGLNIYSVGYFQYRLSLDESGGGSSLEKLPIPPLVGRDTNYDQSVTYMSRLLAITKKKLYIYFIMEREEGYPNVMTSYDLERDEWDDEVYGNYFSGVWSAGVVLFNDRYLFSYGTQNPTMPDMKARFHKTRLMVPGVYVFDIEQRQWFSEPVDGLANDGTILPCVYEIMPDIYHLGPFYSTTYLLQIGKQNDHRLALVRQSTRRLPGSDFPEYLLIWSKFVVTTSTSDQVDHPLFNAGSLSVGSCALGNGIYELRNCATGM